MSDPLPPPAGFEPHPDRGFIDLVGPFWIRRDPEGTAFGFRAEPKHANLIGVVQGGMLMTFADRAMGIAAWDAAGGQVCVTVQFGMHFVSSAKMGEFVTLRPEVVKRTSSMVFLSGTLLAGERVVGVANGIWKILEGRTPV